MAEPVSIGSLIDRFMRDCRREPPTLLARICECWPQIVGEEAALEAKPSAIKGGLLLVHVSSPVWVHHLHFQKQDILERIQQTAGTLAALKDIKFKIGPV
uniref:DUF721 domain-containing protein n=2 Tax=Desulfatirhabdium butyrativorans TaxID=340467 RepID=A0A7C4MN22_9BACT